MNSIQESACHYLFGREASEIYNDSPKFSEEFINESLDTLMRVNIAFLSRRENDGFAFLDPAAFNDQCHLYAYFSAMRKKDYKEKSFEEKRAHTQENRLLHLSFLLSFTFLKDRRLLGQAIKLASDKREITLPSAEKLFYEFIQDNKGTLIRTARQSLNEVFERCIKDTLYEAKERSLLHHELYQLSLEELKLEQVRGKTKLKLYTLPKLLGIAYLVHERMSFVIKTKVITKDGTGTLFYQSAPIKDDEPVLIFETMASDELSITDFREIGEHCPASFDRKPSRKDRHSEKETCLFCNPAPINISAYQERFDRATASIQDTLYALAADFVKEIQLPYMRFFEDKDKYPHLTEIFQQAVPNIEALQLSMRKPLAFTVDHVYVDSAQNALAPQMRMNSSPESFLKERGFL